MARKKHDHFLLGLSTKVLTESFLTEFAKNNDMYIGDSLPFSGPKYQLPDQKCLAALIVP